MQHLGASDLELEAFDGFNGRNTLLTQFIPSHDRQLYGPWIKTWDTGYILRGKQVLLTEIVFPANAPDEDPALWSSSRGERFLRTPVPIIRNVMYAKHQIAYVADTHFSFEEKMPRMPLPHRMLSEALMNGYLRTKDDVESWCDRVLG